MTCLREKYKGTCKKHEDLCELVEDRLKEMGLITHNHMTYRDKGREGEVDVLGFNDKYLILCEIKSSDQKLWKGEEQLYRSAEHYTTRGRGRRIFKMLVYNNYDNQTIYEWIK